MSHFINDIETRFGSTPRIKYLIFWLKMFILTCVYAFKPVESFDSAWNRKAVAIDKKSFQLTARIFFSPNNSFTVRNLLDTSSLRQYVQLQLFKCNTCEGRDGLCVFVLFVYSFFEIFYLHYLPSFPSNILFLKRLTYLQQNETILLLLISKEHTLRKSNKNVIIC